MMNSTQCYSNLDKEISRISEKSTQLLSDTQESKTIADSS